MSFTMWGRSAALFALFGTLGACTSMEQKEAILAPQFQKYSHPKPDLVESSPAVGEKQTVALNKIMYTATYGPKHGARLLADINDENWAFRFTASKGAVFSAFTRGKGGEAIYCTTMPVTYSSLAGNQGGCLIDQTGDGTFDDFSRLNQPLDVYDPSTGIAALASPVPYETVEIGEPEFLVKMNVYFDGIEEGQLLLASAGARTKGGDLPERSLTYADKHRFGVNTQDVRANVDGVVMIIHSATASEITYTVESGGFQNIQFLHQGHLANMRYPIN
ncbi:MAG: hypothetical protein WD034_04840 [Parvibaculum sp.]|uniref:hypothetical protein n=1 Tax=Parvibaculum sp. TaxID=2024848 RepID=UPI0034A02345